MILNHSSSADLGIRVRSTIKRNIKPIRAQQLNCETIGLGTHRNRRVTQSRTTGRRTRKIEPYGTNTRALNLSLTPEQQQGGQPTKTATKGTTSTQEGGRQAHSTLRLSNQGETGPRHTVFINPKGTSAERGKQATGNCVYHPG